ncbi:UvrD-helicase domain-containing protein [Bradyrhizobium japonicum]|uniref:UvrD-helicase domain-containing protein n=1 Tax=Bradyrhizobium japonicum TaxID=375 RepID=UPI001E46919E|nr:UvrD-helicase domain-containing protein [Bradyrhizobium japonicum]MCD9893223.1 UvrD-helicase domain-containing protein [Bradyrhizobium japonicum]WRJ83853.1 UvrD-helicase domain-containing protein [Bradyrhizobium japonicum]WRJ92835.1 UvrD-helicase domain-containing protein [Bradyrhizobium japonicum]WRK46675.1 UvrD-helicase domain-containing protein [Bradyrhizobium japonicum]
MMKTRELPDLAARTAALTHIDRCMLVEAGAGSGKTSIMAGRVAYLFAQSVSPKNVAAITFTEFAASELRIRIERFVSSLSIGEVPDDIARAFPSGVSDSQRQNLIRAKQSLDELLCTTIHGFAQALIKPYPAESGIDPGAEIVDPTEGDLAFNERYLDWLKEHLSGERDDDVIAELVLADESRGLRVIRSIADFLRKNRDARLPNHAWSTSLAKKLSAAAAAFEKEIAQLEFQEEQTGQACTAFIEMVDALGGFDLPITKPRNRALVQAVTVPRHVACFTQSGGKRQLRTKGAWEKAAAAAGKGKAHGTMAFQACTAKYDACHEALSELMAMVAGELLARIVDAMDQLFAEWREYKRSAALLDFDDLLHTARELLAKHDDVRRALGKRYRHVLVDEFQDTDPLQLEILWRLCGDHPNDEDGDALTRVLRPGSLFLVGDPKQAIYRFRGADVNAYLRAREAIGDSSVANIVANFRSVEPILAFVNGAFAGPLSMAAGQPGFTALAATRLPEKNAPSVAALDVIVEDGEDSAEQLRDAEADRVAELCSRIVGNLKIRENGELRPCRFGDIALLAPVGTDLWRFEEALEQCGIPVSTQAGKGFFRRQEIQDFIALTRAIADARDTLALGALLRGPLVGLSETELLDIADGLPTDPNRSDRLPNLSLWTEPDNINHELARDVIKVLQSLARRARSTTPYALLSEAVSLLNVRAHFRHRFPASADRVLANLDLYLEMSRAYDVRGLRAFTRDMRANWEEQVLQVEGRPDAEEQSVALITVHAAKGLEWPIVIPINMAGAPKSETGLMHDRRAGDFSTPVLGIEPASYAQLKSWNELELARERVRLWYVAATRARDLLVLPRHSARLSDKSWARLVDLGLTALPAIEPNDLGAEIAATDTPEENNQNAELFRGQAGKISEAYHTIVWNRPSRHEVDVLPQADKKRVFPDPEQVDESIEPVELLGSATRGTLLHKLMEEVLTGETSDTPPGLERRAIELLSQLGLEASEDPSAGISPVELASTVLRTLMLPEIVTLRPHLVPEQTVFGRQSENGEETLVSGIADALVRDVHGNVQTVIDWKSDVRMTQPKQAEYKAQIRAYCKYTAAGHSMLVAMTPGHIFSE